MSLRGCDEEGAPEPTNIRLRPIQLPPMRPIKDERK